MGYTRVQSAWSQPPTDGFAKAFINNIYCGDHRHSRHFTSLTQCTFNGWDRTDGHQTVKSVAWVKCSGETLVTVFCFLFCFFVLFCFCFCFVFFFWERETRILFSKNNCAICNENVELVSIRIHAHEGKKKKRKRKRKKKEERKTWENWLCTVFSPNSSKLKLHSDLDN